MGPKTSWFFLHSKIVFEFRIFNNWRLLSFLEMVIFVEFTKYL